MMSIGNRLQFRIQFASSCSGTGYCFFKNDQALHTSLPALAMCSLIAVMFEVFFSNHNGKPADSVNCLGERARGRCEHMTQILALCAKRMLKGPMGRSADGASAKSTSKHHSL